MLGLGWATQVGGRIIPVKLFVTRTVNEESEPQVVLVTQRRADNVSDLALNCTHLTDIWSMYVEPC